MRVESKLDVGMTAHWAGAPNMIGPFLYEKRGQQSEKREQWRAYKWADSRPLSGVCFRY